MTDATPWPQLVFATDIVTAAALELALFDSGALSVSYQDQCDQPILEPAPGEVRLWDQLRLTGLFSPESRPALILSAVQRAFGRTLPPHEWLMLPDRQWERVWMDEFQPMRFGDTLWICPTHCEPPDPEAVNLRLDPGLAFGSGTHPTTRLCLEWLANHDVKGRIVGDYGCGSGVLAIAAALLGAESVLATDIDPQALQATCVNAQLNRVESRVRLLEIDSMNQSRVQVLLANILQQPLLALAPVFAAMVEPGGSVVVSGILAEQADSVRVHYNQWFDFESMRQHDEWAVLCATRN